MVLKGGNSRGSVDRCTSSCCSVFWLSPRLPTSMALRVPAVGGLLTRPLGSRCLIWAISRWLGPPVRQTSIAKIRGCWLLKRSFKFCFANLLRDAMFLSCFHSICLLRGQWEGLVTRDYWCWLQIHFKLISTFLSQASNSYCISLILTLF